MKMEYRRESLVEECIRHNVEIRKIRKYLQTKKKKNEFEKLLLQAPVRIWNRGSGRPRK